MLAGEVLPELGDAVSMDSVRLQASDVSEVDDIVVEGRDAHGHAHRSSIAVRRSPALTRTDAASVPLIRDFLVIVTDHWSEVSRGRWHLVLAVSTNANAVAQLDDLAVLARSLPSGEALANRLTQPGRTNGGVRDRYGHLKSLVEQASEGLTSASGLTVEELVWRLLSSLVVRFLRLERTDRVDRSRAVSALQRMLRDGTPAAADALFSRIEELVGGWAPQAAVLTQSVVRRSLSDYPLARSSRYATAWEVLDRLSVRLRDSVRPGLQSGTQSLELARTEERARLSVAMRAVGQSAGTLVVTGEPDVGKSALSLRVLEAVEGEGASVSALSLRDLPLSLPDLESHLGGPSIDDVLASGEVRSVRLLLIDGAESVLEGKGEVLRAVATAALKAGVGVAAVTRTDGSRQVRDALERASGLAGRSEAPAEHVVGALIADERRSLPDAFTALARLGGSPSADWLLGRPGLVDALLRSGAELDPAYLLCEADVFSAVWRSLIRRDEIHAPGAASPDDREQAALGVAKRALGIASQLPHGTAAAELRSAGVLRVPNDPALSPGDEFATDLYRDFALCRLFITEGWEPLLSVGAPRWSIRAARLGCQTALIGARTTNAWTSLLMKFSELAEAEGERWLEVPYEALLTLGDAESAIRDLWEILTKQEGEALGRLLRLAEARYVNGTVGDAFALAPVVRVTFCERPNLDGSPRFGYRTIHEVIRDLVLAWLRGSAVSRLQPDTLRQEVRNVILGDDPPLYDDFAVEALASLGPDLDERAAAWLRKVAKERPGNLNPAVESFVVALSMSHAQSHLLLELAEAYYIERPDPQHRWGGGSVLDDGIRDFKHGLGPGMGMPHAAWYFGPFFRLLNVRPAETIGFINRMLDHAARFRVGKFSSYDTEPGAMEAVEGVQLEVPGVGSRLYVGDGHVWAWYRGTSVGPYPCMSALLALERFVDHLLENLGLQAQTILDLLLRDCHNLAIPGLAVGFLTRHPEAAGTLLDPFLASPAVWHLEAARVTGDYGFGVRDADADKLTGADRRRHTFHETVGEMVVNARLSGDDERLAQLEAVGAKLIESARDELTESGSGSEDYLAVVQSWAEEFRIENYRASRSGDQVLIQFERPAKIEQVLAPRNAELQATNVLYGLQNRYGHYNDNPENWPVETLREDLSIARGIAERGHAGETLLWPENALVAVAGAAVRAHAMDLAALETADLVWAVEALMWAAENPQIDGMSYSGSLFAMGADRAASAALPLLLLHAFDDMNLDRARVYDCLGLLARSVFDEVRMNYVKGCEPVWLAACDIDVADGRCRRHQPAWESATASLVDCRLGPWNQETQKRTTDPLPVPFHESLPAVTERDLMVNRLRMPLACMVDARHVECLQGPVGDLWSPLWDAHRRGLAHWWKQGYHHHAHLTHEPIARRMVEVTVGGDRDPVRAHIEEFATDSNALHLLFDGFATVFTYEEELRGALVDFWPWALEIALDVIGDGTQLRSERHWFDYMTAALLPTPTARSWDSDIDGTFARCREAWLQPDDLGALAGRWLRLARWEPKAVDAVIKFAKGAAVQWQTTVAMEWIEAIVDGRYDLMANHLWYLEEWLTDLRSRGVISGATRSHYHRIVDGLAAAGDRAAVRLQLLDE